MKIIGMIPARLGSKRVKNKNLRLINNKPLIQYIVESAIASRLLDEVYINSEGLVFKEIADANQIQFYHRSDELASDSATNDDFALNFMNNIDCDILIQLLPTSPFLSPTEIDAFIEQMTNQQLDSLISVKRIQIESIFKNKPINFDQKKQTQPSQLLEPVMAYACGIMGWRADSFRENMIRYGAAYHGGSGKIGYFELKGFSTVDIDNEEDFLLAKAIAKANTIADITPEYYKGETDQLIYDADVERILTADGVKNREMDSFNLKSVSINEIIETLGREESWSRTVINSPSNSATLIAQLPGEGNRMHYHHDWDEWWYIIEGEWEWIIEGERKKISEGEVVFIQRGKKHRVTAIGEKIAIRLAVSRYDVDHVYIDDDYHN